MKRISVILGVWGAFTCYLAWAQVSVGGAPVSAGASMWTGASAPSNTLGVNGDLYLNVATFCLYGPKAAGSWPSPCLSLEPLGYAAENTAAKGAANGYAPLDASALVPKSNLPVITSVSGTSIPASTGPDQTLVTTAAGVGAMAPIVSCQGGGLHITYNTATHQWGCDATAGTTASVDFSGVTAAVPNTAALRVGGSLDVAGAGWINANRIMGATLSGITGLVKLTAGVPAAAAAGDVAAALGFTPENQANRGAAGGYAPLDAGAWVPIANLPMVPYSQTTGVQPALGFAPENPANKGQAGGYAPLDSNSRLPDANMPADMITTAALGSGAYPVAATSISAAQGAIIAGDVQAQGSLYANGAGVSSAGNPTATGIATGTVTGAQGATCNLTFAGGGATLPGTGTVALTGPNAISNAAISIVTAGAGYIASPSTATLTNGTAACNGATVNVNVILTPGALHLQDGYGSDVVLSAPSQCTSGPCAWSLPAQAGSAGQSLSPDGSGGLQWLWGPRVLFTYVGSNNGICADHADLISGVACQNSQDAIGDTPFSLGQWTVPAGLLATSGKSLTISGTLGLWTNSGTAPTMQVKLKIGGNTVYSSSNATAPNVVTGKAAQLNFNVAVASGGSSSSVVAADGLVPFPGWTAATYANTTMLTNTAPAVTTNAGEPMTLTVSWAATGLASAVCNDPTNNRCGLTTLSCNQGDTCQFNSGWNNGGTAVQATVACTSQNHIGDGAPITVTAPGYGFTAAPAAATASVGTAATCSGNGAFRTATLGGGQGNAVQLYRLLVTGMN